MTILVTGASGLIGSQVARRLSEAGHRVIGTYLTRKVWMPWPIQMVQVNVTDPDTVRRLVHTSRPEAVVYCASRPRTLSLQAERGTARIAGVRLVSQNTPGLPFLYLSSLKVETDPHAPYSDAQLCCEYLVERRDPRGTVWRLPAIYGPTRRPWLVLLQPFTARVRSVGQVSAQITEWVGSVCPPPPGALPPPS